MSIVTTAQFNLARARKSLEKAHRAKDWQAVREWDVELAKHMDAVFEDNNRDAKALINELQSILMMYAKIVSELPEQSKLPTSKTEPKSGLDL